MKQKNVRKKAILFTIFFFLVQSFLIKTTPLASAQTKEDFQQIQENVKSAVEDVTKQLSGESSSPSAEDAKTIEVIKKRLEKTVESARVQGVSDTARRKHGFIGEVVRVSEETITVSNQTTTTIIPLKDVQLLKGSKKIELTEVAVGNWATVLGFTEGTDQTFTPRVIVISATSLQPSPKLVRLGTITDIDTKKLEIKLRSSGDTEVFALTSKTSYQDNEGTKLVRADFEADTAILITGYEEQNDDGETEKFATIVRSLAPLTQNEKPTPKPSPKQ